MIKIYSGNLVSAQLTAGNVRERGQKMKDPKNEYEELKEKDRLQKNTAKFWGVIITVIVLIAIIWAIASHL